MLKEFIDFIKKFKRTPKLLRIFHRDKFCIELFDKSIKSLKHIAIIADGNRRWAKDNNLHVFEGHRKGFIDVTPKICMELWNWGIHTVTIWCLSTGNWKRDRAEIENLLDLIEMLISIMLPIAKQIEAKIVHLGKKDRLPASLINKIKEAEVETKLYTKHTFNIGIDYSGPDEIIRACQKAIEQGIESHALSENLLSNFMDTAAQSNPIPDLIVRSSGEQRLSGFMMWQSVYSELYFTSKYFPEFDSEVLLNAILDFGKRGRTFSK